MLTEIIWWIIVAVISAIPLNIAAKLLGGESSLLKVIAINVLYGLASGILTSALEGSFLAFAAPIILFIGLLLAYKMFFDVGWIRAFLIWLAQFIILAIIIVILAMLGITLGFLALPFLL